MKISLNLAQERELHRLIDYERSLAEANADPLFRCAFPYRCLLYTSDAADE